MDPTVTARITPSHARRLAWFEDHEGEVTAIPGPLADGQLLVSKPKGIYKPGDLPYALSIRINLDTAYQDGHVRTRPDGGWRLSYHQEGPDPAQRDRMFTNRGLMRCVEDQIPVGVLRERAPAGRRSRYDVLGLAVPVRWYDGYFLFESTGPDGRAPGDTLAEVLQAQAEADAEHDDELLPADDYDARLRLYRQIVARRGQAAFRVGLISAYSGRCAVTGCTVPEVLEAAHLRPYRGSDSNVTCNGLLLRADIHTLLDLQLLAFDPDTRQVVIAKTLRGTQYQDLAGRALTEPQNPGQRPPAAALRRLWQEFTDAETARNRIP
jgi:putative restriction endonuclease